MINRDIVITSRQNPSIKRLCFLLEKKGREASGLFRFDGIKLFSEAVSCGVHIEEIYLRESSISTIEARLESEMFSLSAAKIICVSDDVFEKISEERSPEGIITVARYIDGLSKIGEIKDADIPPKTESVLLLESLRDPGNLGTVLRSAAALGIDRVILSSDCADVYNPKTIRAAMGALFRVSICRLGEGLMPEYIERRRASGRRVFAAALKNDAAVLGSFELRTGDCFVIGNEGHGLSQSTIDGCDKCVIIPMQAGCESLNAAAASVIFMWEMKKI